MNQKIDITKYVATQFGLPTDDNAINRLIPQWWYNPRKKETGGLRLTDEGFARLTAHVKSHKIDFDEPITYTNQLIIWLDNFIDCPWYVTKKEIFVFNEKIAVQLVLFSGDIVRFSAAKAKNPKPGA